VADDFIPVRCAPGTLTELSSNLTRIGPAIGCPDWLLTGAWLCTAGSDYFATAFADVLADGFVARPLCIDRPESISAQIEGEIPDIQGRLVARNSNLRLPTEVPSLEAPETLEHWPEAPYSMDILVRVATTATATHRIACGLFFRSDTGRSLLVGTDKSTLALVVSDDPDLTDRYRSACEELSLIEYQRRLES
jgi:hypothetical protein